MTSLQSYTGAEGTSGQNSQHSSSESSYEFQTSSEATAHLESSFLWIILWLLRVSARSLLTTWPIFQLSHCCRFLNLLLLRVFSKKSCLPFMRNGVRCFWGVPLGSLVLSHECTLRKTERAVRKKQENQKFSGSLWELYQHARVFSSVCKLPLNRAHMGFTTNSASRR